MTRKHVFGIFILVAAFCVGVTFGEPGSCYPFDCGFSMGPQCCKSEGGRRAQMYPSLCAVYEAACLAGIELNSIRPFFEQIY
jgi:hypothetical protein